MYYDLDGVAMNVNAGGNPNSFAMTAGRLIHKVFKIEGLGNIWNLTAFLQEDLTPKQGYYLSAKCSKTALTGEWVLSPTQIPTDGEAGYWHFNFGYLSTVIEGVRSFYPTKGFTLISGGQIETDVITAYLINVNRLFAQVVTVGSNGFVNAGISGLADNGNQSQRFWAGATEENRSTAPFSVLNDGSMRALTGRIGAFNVMENAIYFGPPNDTNANLYFTPRSLYYRTNMADDAGSTAVKSKKELIVNVTPTSQIGMQIGAQSQNTDPGTRAPNIALALRAYGAPNSDDNIALRVSEGNIQVDGDLCQDTVIQVLAWKEEASDFRTLRLTYKKGLLVNRFWES
jgi:hypothetical protein